MIPLGLYHSIFFKVVTLDIIESHLIEFDHSKFPRVFIFVVDRFGLTRAIQFLAVVTTIGIFENH